MTPSTRYEARPTRPTVRRGQRRNAAIVDTHTGKVVDRFISLGTAERVAHTMNVNAGRYPLLYGSRS